jgi:hypothetical protein
LFHSIELSRIRVTIVSGAGCGRRRDHLLSANWFQGFLRTADISPPVSRLVLLEDPDE